MKAKLAKLLMLAWIFISATLIPTPAASAAPTCNQWRLDCSPSISYAEFFHVLELHHSAELADARYLYDRGIAHGIDPAWYEAIICKESTCASRGRVTLLCFNPGNVKWVRALDPRGLHRCPYAGGVYRSYGGWREAGEDWYRRIRDSYINHGARYIWQVVYIYAPPGVDGNNPALYLSQVQHWVTAWRAEDKGGRCDEGRIHIQHWRDC